LYRDDVGIQNTTVVNVTLVFEQVTMTAPLKSEYNCSISYSLNLINYCVQQMKTAFTK